LRASGKRAKAFGMVAMEAYGGFGECVSDTSLARLEGFNSCGL
jgi:hypothetical protein